MFNFNDLKILLDINYKNMFQDTAPKDTMSFIDESDYKDIISGTILAIIGNIILIIIGLVLSSSNVNIVASQISFLNFLPLFMNVIILVMYYYNNKSVVKTNGSFNYVTILFSFFYTIACAGLIIPWVEAVADSTILGLLGVINVLVIVLGNLFILAGSIGYGYKIYNYDIEAHKDKLVHPDITVTHINPNDVKDHSFKYCPTCGQQNNHDSTTCSRCGNML
jgi:hypothetical protein